MNYIMLGAAIDWGQFLSDIVKNHGPFAAGTVFGAVLTCFLTFVMSKMFYGKTPASEWQTLVNTLHSEGNSLRARVRFLENELRKNRKEPKR